MSAKVEITALVPGGILATDHWHRKTQDGTCSRCRRPLPEQDVPLMLWSESGDDMLIYCERCFALFSREISR